MVVVGLNGSRVLVLGGLAAAVAGVFIAVSSGLGAATATSGVAAAEATKLQTVHRAVDVGGTTVRVTTKPSGSVCYSAPHVSDCTSSLGDAQLSYTTAHAGGRVVLAGVAGPHVKAVIARLTHKGTIWPALRNGAFYAVLPHGRGLRSIVKVLAGGRRVAFPA